MRMNLACLLFWILHLLVEYRIAKQMPYKIVSILSICHNKENTTTNHSTLHQEAAIFEKTFKDNIQKQCIVRSCKLPSHLQFEYHDICDNQDTLYELFLNLTLHENYFIKDINRSVALKPYETHILTIFTYLNIKMSTTLASLVKGVSYNWPVIYLNNKFVLPDEIEETVSIVTRNTTESYIQNFEKQIKFFDWKYMAVINIQRKNETVHFLYFEEIVKIIKKSGACFHFEMLDVNDQKNYNKVLRRLNSNRYLKVIILFGDEDDQRQFVSKYTSKNRFI